MSTLFADQAYILFILPANIRSYSPTFWHLVPSGCEGRKVRQAIGSAPPSEGAIRCRMMLGGLLKHYYRQAA